MYLVSEHSEHSISAEEDVQLLFTISAAVQALSRFAFSRLLFPFGTTMTFRSLKLFVSIKMWDTSTLSTK